MKKILYPVILAVIIIGGYMSVSAIFSTSTEIPTALVERGEFVISLNANGSVDAKRAFTITTPRIRGLQITWLAPEGSMVSKGNPVVKFDASEQLAELADYESSLKIAQTTLERTNQEFTIQEKQLTLELKKAERNYDEKKHDAPKLAEEAKIELDLAELNFKAKLDQIKSDVAKAELEVQRAQDRVDRAQKEVDQTQINAPLPGMIVYLDIWKGSSMSKVQEGDSPWPGQGLINIPDLSEMVVNAAVSEVDAAKVDSGQAVKIVLDAFPEIVYDGAVINKGTLARRKEPGSKINVFDVEIAINSQDKQIKPGMSASCRIIMDRLPDVVSAPLEAVFEKEGEILVYLDNKKKRKVEVGRRNDKVIEIISGLEGGERVCLVDPTLEEQGLPGDKATEPELNKGRQLNGGQTGTPPRGRTPRGR
nr:efflux RND transporter periplasmic adaptor subunit [candidate division Zixibacteria bacterium]